MISRVSSKNKGKEAKRKNIVKKQGLNRKKKEKNGTKKQKTASPVYLHVQATA